MKQLTPREKKALGIAGAAVCLFVVFQFMFFPLLDIRNKLVKRLAAREKAVVEMQSLRERFLRINQRTGSLAALLGQREPGFSLFSFLEQNAAESEVKEHIAFMKPSELMGNEQLRQELVEMKLQAVDLRKLVSFLELIESPQHLVGINKITVQENTREQGTLDVTLQMASVHQASASGAP